MKGKKKIEMARVTFRLPEGDRKRLESLSKKEMRSLNSTMCLAIKEYLKGK